MSDPDDYDPVPCFGEDHEWAAGLALDDEMISYCRLCGLVDS